MRKPWNSDLYTFGDVGTDPVTGRHTGPDERLRQLVNEIALSDEGRAPISLASANTIVPITPFRHLPLRWRRPSQRTKRIKLSSAVTVLSSDDPVRIFQQYFDTRQSDRRAAPRSLAGRGSLHRVLPALRQRPQRLRHAVCRKARHADEAQRGRALSWRGGRHTPAVNDRGIYPRPVPGQAARCGSPSAARRNRWSAPRPSACPWRWQSSAAKPPRFAPFFKLYRQGGREGRP